MKLKSFTDNSICEKCGGTDVSIRYIPLEECLEIGHLAGIGIQCNETWEHIDHYCRTCSYRWVTDVRRVELVNLSPQGGEEVGRVST